MDILGRIDIRRIVQTGSFLLLATILGALLTNEPLWLLAPVAFLITCQLIIDFRPVFYLLLLVTPGALEYHFESGFSTDIPTEPLEIVLMFTFIFLVILKGELLQRKFLLHPVAIVLYFHLGWILVATIYSQDIVISLKYVLAKAWYVSVFFFLGGHVLREEKHFKIAFWCLFIPTLAIVINTLIRHNQYGFAFSEVNKSMWPIFRNHVNYAVFLALMFPLLFRAAAWYDRFSWQRMLINTAKVIIAAAIYFSYTGSSWLSLAAALICYFLIRWHMLMPGVAAAIVLTIAFVVYMLHDNTYLQYAPDFKKTIYHDNFSDHLESTATLEDVSSAERIYRWIAGVKMIEAKPVIGFGPSQFHDNYQPYAVNKFTTYISRNEEKSTIHNYYLQVTVEQGFPGLFIWVVFLVTVLATGQRAYTRGTPEQRPLTLVVTLSFITILINIALSDLIEADKIGTMFFLFAAVIINRDLLAKGTLTKAED